MINLIYALLCALICLCLVIVMRTIAFKPFNSNATSIQHLDLDEDSIISHLSKLIQCKTISYNQPQRIDSSEFKKFRNLLLELYPLVHQNCHREEIGDSGILYRWCGKKSDQVTVLMSHYDVVPANEELWSKPAYAGIVEDGVIWGRGTLDTKGTLCGILESAEYLMKRGFVPEQDLYFSFSGDEEISGNSAPSIVQMLKSRGIQPVLVLDEGGAVVENVFPGVTRPSALIGIGEKGYMDVLLEMKGQGGHSSAPPAHTLVGYLAKAIVKIEKQPFKAHFTPAVIELFDTLGRHSTFMYRIIFANIWCFGPVLKSVFKRTGGEMNALLRTTCAPTVMEASNAFNVMPPKASIGLNLRLLGTDSVEYVKAHLMETINNKQIQVTVMESNNASPYASTKSAGWLKVKCSIEHTWENTIVAPYLMLAESDSRHFCEISENVLRFSAMTLSKTERNLIHGNDERITVKAMIETVGFYVRLIEQC
jgi:carboxypeptidase PM20D1